MSLIGSRLRTSHPRRRRARIGFRGGLLVRSPPAWLAALLVACSGGAADPAASTARLLVDADHDGLLGDSDLAVLGTSPAIFLANLDDDDRDGTRDADDRLVSGPDDLPDLAPIQVRAWPGARADAAGTLTIRAPMEHVRVFRALPSGEHSVVPPGELALDSAELREGVSLLVEGVTPLLSTDGAWDGTMVLELHARSGDVEVHDTATMRVAPILFQHHGAPPLEVVYAGGVPWNEPFAEELAAALGDVPLRALRTPGEWDPWAQDFVDYGHTARPGPGGEPVRMAIAVRSPQPERPAGGIVRRLLGPDVGWIFVSLPSSPGGGFDDALGYSMGSFGNWEVIPPHPGWPLGRNVWGAGRSFRDQPDRAFVDFVRAQRVQGELQVDTSWLVVGHVDEAVSFVTEGGELRLLAGSPELAREMLLDLSARGRGGDRMFQGKEWIFEGGSSPAEISVDEVLADADLMAASQEAQAHVDEMVEILTAETGIDPARVIPVPFLFEPLFGRVTAYQPGTVNLLASGRTLVMADPFGPRAPGGEDPFVRDLQERLGAIGYEPRFVDDWDVYHVGLGEVHCATNSLRAIDVAFWEVDP